MKEYEPDVVVGLGILNASIAIRQAKKNGVPFVYYVIDELHRLVAQPMLRYLARFIEQSNMTKSDLVLSINEALRDYTLAMGAVEERTMIVGAGIDVQRFAVNRNRSAIRIHHGIEDGDTLLFFMGWLYDFSGLKELALELAENDPTYRRMKLLILGKGEALDEIREIQKHYGLGNRIVIVQWVPYEQVPDYLSASDICILPSLKHKIMENIVPIKIYEYMAAGKPVIATKSLGLLKEFGKDNGILYVEEPGDVLKEALKMVENGNTCMLGMKGKRYVESRDWEVVTQKFEEILRGLS
jgi:glycosyltransferase involved in cell wall biosynthesis